VKQTKVCDHTTASTRYDSANLGLFQNKYKIEHIDHGSDFARGSSVHTSGRSRLSRDKSARLVT
jgi:hypothetical protein